MKNLLISTLIFFSVFVSVIFFHNELINICDTTLKLNNDIEVLINKEDWDKAYEKSIELYNLVNDKYELISIYINHEDVDYLNTESLKLSQFIETKNLSETLASLHAMKSYASHLKKVQKINLGNILFSSLKI